MDWADLSRLEPGCWPRPTTDEELAAMPKWAGTPELDAVEPATTELGGIGA